MDKRNPFLSVLFTVAIVILTITFSIGLPIYVRPFYYAHIPSIQKEFKEEIDVTLEWDYIQDAYDEVLDFLVLSDREFGTGELPYSEEGKGHFEDCKILFDLNKYALIVSFAVVAVLFIADKLGIIKLARPAGLPLSFWAGLGTLLLFATLAVAVAKDFSTAFEIFHKIFFPGKDNWMFDPSEDPIIFFMPQRFFRNCAILICASILIISVRNIIRGIKKKD